MANTAISIATPDLAIIEGQVTTTSQQVAQHFGKRHADVIRAIRALQVPAEFTERNFASVIVEYQNGKGGTQKAPAYRITRDGFTLLAMGFTGKEAMQWKIAYLNAFNQMETMLHGNQAPVLPNLYKQNPSDKLNSYQQQQLRGLLDEFVKHLPKEKQGAFMMQGWSKLKAHFGVAYRDIPCERFDEAVSLLTRHVVENTVQQQIEAPSMKSRRWLISFNHMGEEVAQPIAMDDCLLKFSELPKVLASADSMVSSPLLADIANACLQRLAARSSRLPLAA